MTEITVFRVTRMLKLPEEIFIRTTMEVVNGAVSSQNSKDCQGYIHSSVRRRHIDASVDTKPEIARTGSGPVRLYRDELDPFGAFLDGYTSGYVGEGSAREE